MEAIVFSPNPVHSMNTWFVMKLDRGPGLCPVRRWNQVENGAIFNGLPVIPLPPDRDLAFSITVNIPCRDANVITLGQIFGDHVLGPIGVLVPLDGFLVRQNDIRFSITVNVCHLETITDIDLVDFLGPPLKYWNVVGDDAGSRQHKNGQEGHEIFHRVRKMVVSGNWLVPVDQ